MTYIDDIIKNKKKIPGPSSYNPVIPKSKKSYYASKARAGNAFIDEATYKARETPEMKNLIKYVSYDT